MGTSAEESDSAMSDAASPRAVDSPAVSSQEPKVMQQAHESEPASPSAGSKERRDVVTEDDSGEKVATPVAKPAWWKQPKTDMAPSPQSRRDAGGSGDAALRPTSTQSKRSSVSSSRSKRSSVSPAGLLGDDGA